MGSLLEISNTPRSVEIEGKQVDVFGISIEHLIQLMVRFPEIGKMMSGVKENLNSSELTKLAPTAIGAIIAAGTGHLGNEDAERIGRKLGVQYQLDLIDEILRLTFPRGVGPFVKKLEALGMLAQVEAVSQRVPSSPAQSKNSSGQGTSAPSVTPPVKSSSS